MDSDNDWSAILNDHPIFSLQSSSSGQKDTLKSSLELSSNTLPDFTSIGKENPTPSGRRQVMLLKAADLILAVGKEIRMASLGDARLNPALRKTYKVCSALPQVLQSLTSRSRLCILQTFNSRFTRLLLIQVANCWRWQVHIKSPSLSYPVRPLQDWCRMR